VLGKFSHSASGSASNGSSGKIGLILGGVAAIALAAGAGIYFVGNGYSVMPRVAPVAAVSQPDKQVPAVPASTPTPATSAVVNQTAAEEAPQVFPLTPAAIPKDKEIAATVVPSAQQPARRKAETVPATQPNQLAARKTEAATPRPEPSRNLKMSTPTTDSQSGRLVDGSVPNIDDAIVTGAVKVPGGGLISTASHPNLPPPPGGLVGSSPSGAAASEPKLISSTRPVYPPQAKENRIEGDVILAADIDSAGRVIAARATAGPMYLRQAAVDAVLNWKYQPASLNGKPTSSHTSIKIEFRLK
jgi:TonB family protein